MMPADPAKRAASFLVRVAMYNRRHWEPWFFLITWLLLTQQVRFFQLDVSGVAHLHPMIARFAAVNAFIFHHSGPAFAILCALPFFLSVAGKLRSDWERRFSDFLATYAILRMIMQLIGLNILVFDYSSPRFLLITQLIFFLPYMLLIWGWIYWRLDVLGLDSGKAFFRLDHEGERPRALDYFVASFSSVFSASISGIKGTSARSRMLILLHGFMIYDVMGLTLSRAVALVQR
jgi:hypothetical protein